MNSRLKTFISKLWYWKSINKFKSCGSNIQLSRGGFFIHPEEIEFGSNIFINEGFHISARQLKLGNNIMIGPKLIIECDNHVFNHVGKTVFELSNERNVKPVTIQNDVWIGARVTILPGVTVREGCIVGAGSVVTKPLPPYTVCVGNPCRPIHPRFSFQELREHLELQKEKTSLTFDEIISTWEQYNLNIR